MTTNTYDWGAKGNGSFPLLVREVGMTEIGFNSALTAAADSILQQLQAI